MVKFLLIATWLLITFIVYGITLKLLSKADSMLNYLSYIISILWILLSFKTQCFTKFKK